MSPRLNAAAVDCFLQATSGVLRNLVQDTVEWGAVSMRSAAFTTQEFSIMVEVTGDFAGRVLLGMSRVTASRIASVMQGQVLVVFDDAARSAIAELGNMLSAHAAAALQSLGYQCEIALPSALHSPGQSVCELPTVVLPLYTDLGKMELEIAFSPCAAGNSASPPAGQASG